METDEDAKRIVEIEAYTAVVKAFAVGDPSWDKDDVLTRLRIFLKIENEYHMNLMASIREGRPPPRPARAAAKAAPATSLGGAAPGGWLGAGYEQQGGAGRRQAHSYSHSSGQGDSDEDYSEELSRQSKQLGKKQQAKGGGGGGKRQDGKRSGSALLGAPSMRRPSAPRPPGGALARTASAAALPRSGSARPRSSRPRDGRFVMGDDPFRYVGRRVWRYWSTEDPPWVEGYVSVYSADSNDWTIIYDPNTHNETMEENFNFQEAAEGIDFVMAEYVDVAAMIGSRRQAEKPVISPAAYAALPPFTMQAPSKKRKQSMHPVPTDAPFDNGYFASRVPVAGEEELQQMLTVLERTEKAVEAELQELDNMEADSSLLEERAKLERKFAELCDREDDIMRELQRLKAMEA